MVPGTERRNSLRRRDSRIIRFILDCKGNEFGYGLTGDVGRNGLWFYTSTGLEPGDSLKILANELLPCDTAVVRWAREVEGRMLQVGIECFRASRET